MTVILNAATDAQLAAAVEDNLYAFFRAMLPLPGSELVETDRLSYHLAFPDGPMFKGVWRARLAPDEADAAITQALDWFQQRRAALTAWWISGTTEPDDLADRLLARGFSKHYAGEPGMAADLDALDELPIPTGLSIVRAQDRTTLTDWRDVICAAFNLPVAMMQSWVDATLAYGIDAAPWRHYVGYYFGEPVATSYLYNGGGVAGLYCIATAPHARQRGFGAAITRQPMLDARAQGYHYAVLFASPSGARLYPHIGFRDTGCRISRYVREADKVTLLQRSAL